MIFEARRYLGAVGFLAALAASVTACSEEVGDGAEEAVADDDDDGADGADSTGTSSSAVSLPGRWTLPAAVRTAGARVRITYDDGPAWNSRLCAGGLRAGTQKLRTHLDQKFPDITSLQGYACRANTANASRMSIHGTGRALDIFIPRSGSAADNTKGDKVANYLVSNAQELQIQYIIWDRTKWRANGTNDAAYTGPNPHTDHLHVEITEEAAAKTATWYR